MEKLSISQIKALLKEENVSADLIEELRADGRKGIQNLLKSYDGKIAKKKLLRQKFDEMSGYEWRNRQAGCRFIAGVDEAGRGPLAGPVVAGAVILPADFVLLGLNDSKQLSRQTRESFFEIITQEAVSYGIGIVDNKEIDAVNIYQATIRAMHQALHQLDPEPDHVLIDAVRLSGLGCTSESFPKGDQKSVSIAAASILAKVTRDRIMDDLHREFPVYNFASNMGYGTKDHMETLRLHGVSPYHRMSFSPVKEAARN